MCPYVPYVFGNIFGNTLGMEVPDLVNMLTVPKMSNEYCNMSASLKNGSPNNVQKILQYVRKP